MNMTAAPNALTFDYQRAARYTGLSPRQLQRAVSTGQLTHAKPSGPTGPVRFSQKMLDDYLDAITVGGVSK